MEGGFGEDVDSAGALCVESVAGSDVVASSIVVVVSSVVVI